MPCLIQLKLTIMEIEQLKERVKELPDKVGWAQAVRKINGHPCFSGRTHSDLF